MPKLITAAQPRSAPIPTIDVEVPEWGGTARVRALSPRLRMTLLDAIATNEREIEDYDLDQAKPEVEREGLAKVERLDQTVLTVLYTLVDERNKPLLTMTDYETAMELSLPTLKKLWNAMQELEAGSVGDLKKTSK